MSLCLQEYVRQIGGCLLQLGESTSSGSQTVQDATSALQLLTVEAANVLGCLLSDPVANKTLISTRLDEGHHQTAGQGLDAEFYANLVVSF